MRNATVGWLKNERILKIKFPTDQAGNAGCLFGAEVVDEGVLQLLRLHNNIGTVTTARQADQCNVVRLLLHLPHQTFHLGMFQAHSLGDAKHGNALFIGGHQFMIHALNQSVIAADLY